MLKHRRGLLCFFIPETCFSSSFFLKCSCIHACGYDVGVCVCVCAIEFLRRPEEGVGTLKLKLYMLVYPLTWVSEVEFVSSGGVTHDLHHRAISLRPCSMSDALRQHSAD